MVFVMNQELYRLITIAYKARESYRKAQDAYVYQAKFLGNGFSQSSYRRFDKVLESAGTYQRALYDLWSKLDSTESFPGKEELLQRIMALLDALFEWRDVMARKFHGWLEPYDRGPLVRRPLPQAHHKTTIRIGISVSNFDKEKRRILLVEDCEDARDLATLTLTEYTLICARSFDEGLRLAKRRYFDLYILDNWLPGGNGVGLCRLIREFDPHTPVLFFSAAANQRDIEECLRAGAQAYLVKPIVPDELRQTVSRLDSIARAAVPEAQRVEIAAIREALAISRLESAELSREG